MLEINTTKLEYPKNQTWFICWSNDRAEVRAYGSIETNQTLETRWIEVDYYTNEVDWLGILEGKVDLD